MVKKPRATWNHLYVEKQTLEKAYDSISFENDLLYQLNSIIFDH